MTRISSLFVATTLALLPIGAFAQQNAAPANNTAPTSMTSATPATTAPGTDKTVTAKVPAAKTANVTQSAKSDVKTPVKGAKTEVHGLNGVTSHHAKANVPAKTAEPAKS